jgi:lambda repressor-like predicted transcriptional regulator
MEQLDRLATERVLRAMAVAGVTLDEIIARTGMSRDVLMSRLAQGPWKLVELGKIAKAIGCPPEDLMPTEAAA